MGLVDMYLLVLSLRTDSTEKSLGYPPAAYLDGHVIGQMLQKKLSVETDKNTDKLYGLRSDKATTIQWLILKMVKV